MKIGRRKISQHIQLQINTFFFPVTEHNIFEIRDVANKRNDTNTTTTHSTQCTQNSKNLYKNSIQSFMNY